MTPHQISRKQFIRLVCYVAAVGPTVLGCDERAGDEDAEDDAAAEEERSNDEAGVALGGRDAGNGAGDARAPSDTASEPMLADGQAGEPGEQEAGSDPLDGGQAVDAPVGDADQHATDAADGGASRCDISISDQHATPHTLEIPAADLTEPATRFYVLRGGDHMHDLLMAPSDFTTLASGGMVELYSRSSLGHAHIVTIRAC